jgi:dihydroorotate dehydrogenase electron transfer subunit
MDKTVTPLMTDRKPVMLKVVRKEMNSPAFATLFFDYALPFRPGQFLMVWLPGIDEKPYTISYHSDTGFGITIEAKGIFSQKAITLEKGDLVGIRGPFGNGFSFDPDSRSAVIAGGCGMAPLATLVEQLPENTLFIHGARSKEFILYPDRFTMPRKFCTDDGSFGTKGLVIDLFKKELDAGLKLDMVFACGPEIMMAAVFELCKAHGLPCQLSLERYMRCGFGVCGACVCGDRVVCKDGPVFGSASISKMKDFNTKALLKSGKDVDLSTYFSWRCQ